MRFYLPDPTPRLSPVKRTRLAIYITTITTIIFRAELALILASQCLSLFATAQLPATSMRENPTNHHRPTHNRRQRCRPDLDCLYRHLLLAAIPRTIRLALAGTHWLSLQHLPSKRRRRLRLGNIPFPLVLHLRPPTTLHQPLHPAPLSCFDHHVSATTE